MVTGIYRPPGIAGDIADQERDEGPEVAEGPRGLPEVVVVARESHEAITLRLLYVVKSIKESEKTSTMGAGTIA